MKKNTVGLAMKDKKSKFSYVDMVMQDLGKTTGGRELRRKLLEIIAFVKAKSIEHVVEETEENKNKPKAVIFVHPFLTGNGLVENNDSIDQQIAECKEMIQDNNWRLTKVISMWPELMDLISSQNVNKVCYRSEQDFMLGMSKENGIITQMACVGEDIEFIAAREG